MEARTAYFNFMGQKWTVETNADFSFPISGVMEFNPKVQNRMGFIVGKPSLDENDKKEIKQMLTSFLMEEVVKAKFGDSILINKNGEKNTNGGKIDWENVLDGDLLYCIAEKNEEIQTALAEVYKEVMDFVATM